MSPDELAARLAEVAQQLVCGVRDDDPEANLRWLRSQVRPEQYEALLVVLAAAVPTNQTWLELTAWTTGAPEPRRLRPHGTRAAARRHDYHKEPYCEPCRAWARTEQRARREAA